MGYDKGLVEVTQLVGGALTGWSMTTGRSRTGETGDVRQPATFAAVTVADGYSVGDRGELSLDPATGTATIVDYVTVTPGGDPGYGAGRYGLGKYGLAQGGLELPAFTKGDRVEISYDSVIVLAGMCTEVTTTFTPTGEALAHGRHAERRTVANLSSIQRLMLQSVVAWADLPEEPAITRLSRFFTVNVGDAPAAALDTLMPAEDAGSATLLDLARAFSEATLLPLRTPGILSPDDWPRLDVITLPGTPAPGFDGSEDWAVEAEYTNGRPARLTIKANDTRLSNVQDGTGPTATGFRAPNTVDAFGRTVTAHRVTQSFDQTYNAQIEVL